MCEFDFAFPSGAYEVPLGGEVPTLSRIGGLVPMGVPGGYV